MSEIVRFAPSPTGFLHVGGARTAIFNWLIARQNNGKFLLRIEDTDRERSTPESVEQIIESLSWIGIDWDGEVVYQSRRLERHKSVVQELVRNNKAYPCFCTKEELAERRKTMEKQGETFRYDGRCDRLARTEVQHRINNGLPFAIRLRIPEENIEVTDLIHGDTVIESQTLDDFIIQRMDGTPTYQLAVVIDDHDMEISLVLRGDDHLSNTPKQIALYMALGWVVPRFAHVPLILGPDKVRLSKRHGATSIREFREMGMFPEALFNYLCLLGWAPGDDKEFMSREEIVNRFKINRINTSAAVFDIQKLRWLNRKYLSQISLEMIKPDLLQRLNEAGLQPEPEEQERFSKLITLYQQRCYTMSELTDALKVFFHTPVEYDPKGKRKFFDEKGLALLTGLDDLFAGRREAFESSGQLELLLREYAAKRDVSAAKVIHPLRLALTGKTESPGIFDLLYILGYKKTRERIKRVFG